MENGFGVENGFFIGDWISNNLYEFVQISWLEGKKNVLLVNKSSELFVDILCFIICELNQ